MSSEEQLLEIAQGIERFPEGTVNPHRREFCVAPDDHDRLAAARDLVMPSRADLWDHGELEKTLSDCTEISLQPFGGMGPQ